MADRKQPPADGEDRILIILGPVPRVPRPARERRPDRVEQVILEPRVRGGRVGS